MKKAFETSANFMRKGVMVLYCLSLIQLLFFGWYWTCYIFRAGNEVFSQSTAGNIDWRITIISFISAIVCAAGATIMHTRDTKRNKLVPYDGKFDKNVFFTS